MARITAIFADQIDDAALGDGLKKNATDDTKFEVAIKSSAGLKFDTGELAVEPADIAGNGLTDDGSDKLTIQLDGTTLSVSASGLKVADGGITATQLSSSVAGNGLSGGAGTPLSVNVDDVTLEIVSDSLNVKDSGITTAKIADNAVNSAKLDLSDTYDFATAGGTLKVGTPSADNDVANKSYVDNVAQGLDVKESVKALATTNQTLSGLPTDIDGVTSWSAGDRVLLTGQTNGVENGIWEVQTGSWTRPSDFANGASVAGAFCFVEQGDNYADTGWVCTNDSGSDVVGTDSLSLSQFSGAGQITAGTGLTKSGNTIHVGDGTVGVVGGINRTADDIAVAVDNSTLELNASGYVQIKDAGVTEAKLAASVAGDGLTGGAGSALSVNVDNSTIEIVSDALQVKDGGITEAKLDINNAPTDGYYLKWNASAGKMEWSDIDVDAVQDSDVVCNEIPAGSINSVNTVFTLANSPVAGTVTVYLNGLYQAPGVGKDYTISGKTITFAKAPRTNSELYVCYIKQ